jgi:hypothetical protein
MKPFALLVLLVLAIAAAVAPGVHGLEADSPGKQQFFADCGLWREATCSCVLVDVYWLLCATSKTSRLI